VGDDRKPVGQPPVDVVGDVLGPVGADVVAEPHPRGDDEVLRSEVHGAQVDERVNPRCVLEPTMIPAASLIAPTKMFARQR